MAAADLMRFCRLAHRGCLTAINNKTHQEPRLEIRPGGGYGAERKARSEAFAFPFLIVSLNTKMERMN